MTQATPYTTRDPDRYGRGVDSMHAQSDQSGRHGLKDAAHRAAERGSEIAHRATDLARNVGRRAEHIASDTAHRVSDAACEAADRVAHGARVARTRGKETVRDHPLAVAGAMFGLGLLIGVALPTTRREDRWFGEEADDLKRSAKRMGEDALERGKRVATATVAAAREEAQKQGITPESLRERAEKVATKAADTAEHEAKREVGGGQSGAQ